MSKKLSALVLTTAAASLLSSSVVFACFNCLPKDDHKFTAIQQQQVNQIIGQLSAPGKEGQVSALVDEFVSSHVQNGYSVDEALIHLDQVAQ